MKLNQHINVYVLLLPPQSFPGMSQQYGVPVGSSVNVMSGPGGAGGSIPGSGGGGHPGPGPYSGPSMQYHPGTVLNTDITGDWTSVQTDLNHRC